MNKKCSICKIVKDISLFYKRSHSGDGFRSECKSCDATMYKKQERDRIIKINNRCECGKLISPNAKYCGRCAHIGERSHLFGKRFSDEHREKIRNKFNRQCFMCHDSEPKDYKLSVHHINYNKNDHDETNLVPLCKRCHNITNFRRSYWVDYLKEVTCKSQKTCLID